MSKKPFKPSKELQQEHARFAPGVLATVWAMKGKETVKAAKTHHLNELCKEYGEH
jgi:hypothetical protein